MDVLNELREMKDTIAHEIAEANERIRKSGGDMNTADVEIIDKLTHSMKSLATTVAMLEAEDENGYSGHYAPYYGGGYSGRDRRDGYSGNSGERDGRVSGNRYSRNSRGYSRTGDMTEHFRQLMDEAPDESTRMELKRLMDRMA